MSLIGDIDERDGCLRKLLGKVSLQAIARILGGVRPPVQTLESFRPIVLDSVARARNGQALRTAQASSGLCASYVPTEGTAQQAQTDKSAGLVAWNLSERSKEPVMLADTYRQRHETLLVNLLKLLTNDWAMTSQLSQLKAGLPRAIHQRFVASSTQY
eukprot:COSAG02_NODE_51_length_44689_cov_29.477361_38_plen_158_part_00